MSLQVDNCEKKKRRKSTDWVQLGFPLEHVPRQRVHGQLLETFPRRRGKPNHNSILHSEPGCKCIFNEANARASRPGQASVNITVYLISLIRHVVPGPQAGCLPACSTPFTIVVLVVAFALLQNHFANPSTCQVTGRCCPASSVAAFHLLEMQKGTRVAAGVEQGGGRGQPGRQSGRETANIFRVRQTHNEFVTLSLTLEINSKRTWASSINMRQGHDRVYYCIYIFP